MEGGPPEFPRDFACPAVLGRPTREEQTFHLRGSHPLWRVFPNASVRLALCDSPPECGPRPAGSHDPACATLRSLTRTRFGLFPFRSPLLGKSLRFLFLWVLRCLSSPRSSPPAYAFSRGRDSEIPGSKPACGSPGLIAAMQRPSSPPGAKTSPMQP